MKRILFATDLSDGARQALVRAIALAAQSHASLVVLHAAPGDDADREKLRADLAARVRAETGSAGIDGLDIEIHVSARAAEQAILHEAKRCGADLIVLGGHSEPRFRDAIFGTVGTHLARHASIPILIVQTDPALSYSKLMVAADSPDAAAQLAQNALAVAPTGEVFTVHAVLPSVGQSLFCRDALAEALSQHEESLKSALTRISPAHPQALLDAHGHILVEEGDPLTVIMDKTDELLPDLVVMGTHHRGTFITSRGVDALFWCPADLLIVPDTVAVPVAA
jgi:nucleotide-binding universal stress UspA family protein